MFIIYDIDNKSLDDLIKLKFLKKISFIKSKRLQMSRAGLVSSSLRHMYSGKGGSAASPSSPLYSISSAALNYTDDEMRKFASFALERLNHSLLSVQKDPTAMIVTNHSASQSSSSSSSSSSYSVFLFTFVVLSVSVFVIIFGFRFFATLSNKKRQQSALNALLAKLNQASMTSPTTTRIAANSTIVAPVDLANNKDRVSFKLLLKDLNSFRNRYFTVRLPKLSSPNGQEPPQLSSASSSTSSSSCGLSQFKQLSENKQSNVR